MAPILNQSVLALSKNTTSVFKDAVDILLRVSSNILANPSNPKFRSISLGSNVVVTKLLPASGAMECLFEMGFEEGSDKIELPLNKSLDKLRQINNELKQEKEKKLSQPAAPTPCPSTSTSTTTATKAAINDVNRFILKGLQETGQPANSFIAKLIKNAERARKYEDIGLQRKALNCIPLLDLQTRLEKAIRELQRDYKMKKIPNEQQNIQEVFLVILVAWFKNEFFSWINSPACYVCGEENTKSKGVIDSSDPGIDRIEVYECPKCHIDITFPRYNDAGKLLETRKGRCGEWANCFTLICRALKYDARLVLDETDHAWTEVYLNLTGRWVHCDPCESVVDAPLLYEAGWKKSLTYVIAYSCEEIQDVTWRYSSQHKQVLKRRKMCAEEELVQFLLKFRQLNCEAMALTEKRKQFVMLRSLRELVEMLEEKQPTENDIKGRISGAWAWRSARGETGDVPTHVWSIKEADTTAGTWVLGYSASKDQYVLGATKSVNTTGWLLGVHSMTNIHRKVENDWKIAYLARTEECESGTISWRFEIDKDLTLENVEIVFGATLFQSGKATATLCSGDICVRVPTDGKLLASSAFKGCQNLVLSAVLTGGDGDVAWQHAQLFRQPLNDHSNPFQIILKVSTRR